MNQNDDLIRRDLAVLWHPCTQMKDHESLPLIPIRRGEGVWLEDFNGKRYLDAVSSWWVNLFGHANPRISARVKQQLDQLEHVILAGFTHEPVVELSERLFALTPPALSRVFYADNGSSGIEVALKMSFHYWLNRCGGDPARVRKTKFVTLGNSYHGETLAALAVGNVDLYKHTYQPLLMTTFTAPSPDAYLALPGESAEDCALRAAAELEKILQQHGDEICALIVEPLVQCAGSMRMYHPAYLKKASELCKRYEVHLIADEIAVGFGRTGTLFACEQAGITPDFLCLSKGLTGGYLPLCAVLTTDTIYDMFYADYASLRGFLHSHSYTGNPLACAAALATLDIFRDDNVLEQNQKLIRKMQQATTHFKDHPHVADVRQTGMILAIELVKNKTTREPYPWQERRGLRVYQLGLDQGALLRPLGSVVYFMPPYVITEDQIDWLAQVAWEGIQKATQD
ncbi:MAG: adenosylmethionine--8-amino-7-oxononanoate transaminase [Gammaproteobacteria bacterium]|nr:adenosylmethionine--8-amino-7-oxononanoate transaminase [Gammaproteobacteria bacterium]